MNPPEPSKAPEPARPAQTAGHLGPETVDDYFEDPPCGGERVQPRGFGGLGFGGLGFGFWGSGFGV